MDLDLTDCLDQLSGSVRELRRGDVLFREGELGESFFFVQSGRLRAVRGLGTGQLSVVGEIGRGELVGEMAVLSDAPRFASVVAVRDTTVIEISGSDLDRLPKESLMHVMRVLAQRLRNVMQSKPRHAMPACIVVVPTAPGLPVDRYMERLRETLLHAGGHCEALGSRDLPSEFEGLAEDRPDISARLGRWLDEMEGRGRLLLLRADYDATPWTERCVRQADLVLLLARASDDPRKSPAEQEIDRLTDPVTRPRVDLVLLQKEAPYRGTSAWLSGRVVTRHYHVRLHSEEDAARAGRMLTGHDVSFVLGGGGARGFAHLGVLRACQELGIPVDRVCGTSMGAAVGAMVAMGLPWDEITERMRAQFLPAKRLVEFTLPLLSIDTARRYVRALERLYGDTRIEDLPMNYFCVSCNLTRASVVVHRTGGLAKWVGASMSMPGIAPPLVENGEMIVDGGLLNNLPVDVAKDDGAGLVVGVDVSPDTEFRLPAHYSGRPRAWEVLKSRLFRPKPGGAREAVVFPTLASIVHRACSLSSVYEQAKLAKLADLYLKVPVEQFSLLQFDELDAIAAVGRETGRAQLASVAEWCRSPRKTMSAPPFPRHLAATASPFPPREPSGA